MFETGEKFREFTLERRRVGRLTIKSNQIAVCDPFGLGFGVRTLARKVPRGRFPVEVALAHARKGPRKGQVLVAAARVRLGEGRATGYRLAELPEQPARRWLGAEFSGYASESGFGCFACGEAAAALDRVCAEALARGELDTQLTQMLRMQLVRPDGAWASGELIPVMREGSLVAMSAGHGEGYYPSYWGYDDQRRLVSLVTDFFVLPTRPELVRESWADERWRELHYAGDRAQRFWRVKVEGLVRTIEHGTVGRPGQSSVKEFTTSTAAYEAATKRIQKQLDAGYFELSSSAQALRHLKSQRLTAARAGALLPVEASSSLAVAARIAFSEPKGPWKERAEQARRRARERAETPAASARKAKAKSKSKAPAAARAETQTATRAKPKGSAKSKAKSPSKSQGKSAAKPRSQARGQRERRVSAPAARRKRS